jgi:hypothetical protein
MTTPNVFQEVQERNKQDVNVAVASADAPSYTEEKSVPLSSDLSGNARVTLGTTLAGEDTVAGVMKVEHRYSYAFVQSDTAVKSTAGFLHALTFSCADAAPTAGSITVYDNTAASGTKIFEHTFTTTAFMPFSVLIDATFGTGLYVDFTTTADVNVTVSYR